MSEKRNRKDKEVLVEFENLVKDIRQQLTDQLKCLETKLEAELALVAELQEYFKRRSELELDYSRSLDKLVRQTMLRHRTEKQKFETLPRYSTYACWQNIVGITKKQSQEHQVLSDIYNIQMVQRLNDIMDNSKRIYAKCREIGCESHEDIMQVLNSLQSTMKTYHMYQAESKQAEAKLLQAESQKSKIEKQMSGKGGTSRKLKSFEKQVEKRQVRYFENKQKALKARNEYLLTIEAANAAINKYFSDDLSNLMDGMDFGYHNAVGRSMMMYLSTHEEMKSRHQGAIDLLNKCITDLDSQADKQKFMEFNNTVFMLPRKFEFQPYRGDEMRQISAQKPVQDQLIQECETIGGVLSKINLENDEVWKTLETAEKHLMDMINEHDYEVSNYFHEETSPPKSPHELSKKRADRVETESFYLEKFRKYTLSCNKLARLQAKYLAIQKALGENQLSASGNTLSNSRPPSLPPKPRKRRIGRTPHVGQPKLFGGSLEEYIETTSEEIPLIMKSCIRIINLYGMHHQGIFRVSGAQVEINDFKNAFEKGDDPLLDMMDASDINSVAGVLKLYFRELREPLFPLHLFDELISCSKIHDLPERLEKIRDLIKTLPATINVVMRYLFAFLNHLSEYSDENMMDPYNLAICFGPTLLPIPPDRDQVQFQNSVNEVIKTIIMHQDEIFPKQDGPKYEKFIIEHSHEDAVGDEDTSSIPSDEEPEVFEATALYDFDARTDRELSFKKADILLIYSQKSVDWWEGCFNGKEGLIPTKYITLKSGEDRRSQGSTADHENEKIGASSSSLPLAHPKLPSVSSSSSSEGTSFSSLEKSVSQSSSLISPPLSVSSIISPSSPVSTSPPPLPAKEKDATSSNMSLLVTLPVKETDIVSVDIPVSEIPVSTDTSSIMTTSSMITTTTTTTSTVCEITKPVNLPEVVDTSISQPAPESSPPQGVLVSDETFDTELDTISLTINEDDFINSSLGMDECGHREPLETQLSLNDSNPDDLCLDIDSALAEVMSGLKSLEIQQRSDKRMSLPVVKVKQMPKHTPDLVLDLPKGGSDSPPDGDVESRSRPDSPTLSLAETFAKSNQSTLKKATSVPPVMALPMITASRVGEIGHVNRLSLAEQLLDDDSPAAIIKRSASTNAAMRARTAQLIEINLEERLKSSSTSLLQPQPYSHPPNISEKPKPPIKVKPQLLRKPMRSPETHRKGEASNKH